MVIPDIQGYSRYTGLYLIYRVIPDIQGYTIYTGLYQIYRVIPDIQGYTKYTRLYQNTRYIGLCQIYRVITNIVCINPDKTLHVFFLSLSVFKDTTRADPLLLYTCLNVKKQSFMFNLLYFLGIIVHVNLMNVIKPNCST